MPDFLRWGTDAHLSDDQLLMALDGELSSRKSARIERHLEACWSCRVRSAHIEAAITDVVEYRNLVFRNSSLSPASRTMFMVQLEQLAHGSAPRSLGTRTESLFRALHRFSQSLLPRHVWMGGVVMAVLMLLWLTNHREVPKISKPELSASQLLEYAQISEIRSLHGVATPVVYQKLRIRVGEQDVMRTSYHDVNGTRQVNRIAVNNDGKGPRGDTSDSWSPSAYDARLIEVDLRQTFEDARLNWEDPLSATSYRSWRDSLRQKREELEEGNDGSIVLKTRALEGRIAEASIKIRPADFHAVAGKFLLQDSRLLDVEELDWRVIPMQAVDLAVFVDEPTPVIVSPKTRIPSGPKAELPESELQAHIAKIAESELQARIVLHGLGADLGEEIWFDREATNIPVVGQRSLILRGILSTSERKSELSTALGKVPNLELQLLTMEEAAARGSPPSRQDDQGMATPWLGDAELKSAPNAEGFGRKESSEIQKPVGEDDRVGRLFFDEQMQRLFPHVEDRIQFGNRVMNLVQNALAWAWALRRLKDHYKPEEVVLLSQESRRELELLIYDDVLAFRRSADEVRQVISPLLMPEPGLLTEPHLDPGARLIAAQSADWREAVGDIFPEVQTLDSSTVALFAQPDQTTTARQARITDLRSALINLETYLPILYEQVKGSFLSNQTRKPAQ